jgi:hypothetical protein
MNSRTVFMIKKEKTPSSSGLREGATENEHTKSSKANRCKRVMAKICITGYSELAIKFVHKDGEKE